MKTKTIICIGCSKEAVVKKSNSRTKRCKECQGKVNKEYQVSYHKEYLQGASFPVKEGRKRTYLSRGLDSIEDLEYCKNNFDKVGGCLNCIIAECLQPIDSDSFLPWEQEGFTEKEYLNER